MKRHPPASSSNRKESDESRRSGDERSFRPGERGPADLPAKDRQLMTEHQDLRVFGDGVHAMERRGLDDAAEQTVEEAEHHGRAGSSLGSCLIKATIALFASGALVVVPRHPRDDPAMAPGPRSATLDLPTPPSGATAAPRGDHRAHRTHGYGEPALGVPGHRRRTEEAWCHGLEGQRRQRPRTPRASESASGGSQPGSGSSAPRPRASW